MCVAKLPRINSEPAERPLLDAFKFELFGPPGLSPEVEEAILAGLDAGGFREQLEDAARLLLKKLGLGDHHVRLR